MTTNPPQVEPVEGLADELRKIWDVIRVFRLEDGTSLGDVFKSGNDKIELCNRLLSALRRSSTVNDELVEHLREQITHVETRIQDGHEMGAAVWRIALEDIVRENRAALAKISGGEG